MSLRWRLAAALLAAALFPMTIVVGVPLLRADARARAEAARRLDLVAKQATFLLERRASDTGDRTQRAAIELGRDRVLLEPVLSGPEAAARSAAAALAQAYGLDWLEVAASDGTVLAATDPGRRIGTRRELAEIPEEAWVVGAWVDPTRAPAGIFTRRPVPSARETVWLAGGSLLDRRTVDEIFALTGELVFLEGPDGARMLASPPAGEASPRATHRIELPGEGWSAFVSAPAADAGRERRDLLAAFAGIAPIALLGAVVLGTLLAGTISRPIRDLADRADEISLQREGFRFLVDQEPNEVRSLIRSFDRMVEALEGSERRRAAAERVAAWEQVARRIAHEVKNPLSPIQLAVENLRRTREKAPAEFDAALRVETATILEEVSSLRRLVDEFSEFARLPRPSLVACDANALVEQALALYAARIEALSVRVALALPSVPIPIVADPQQIGRVLKNVIANALDAVEGVADRTLSIDLLQVGEGASANVAIEVRDSGVGLDPEAARRIFEPYFTTRADRGGTGLGMAIAYRIIVEHGGSIEASGATGRGATLKIRLPQSGPRSGAL